jgi:PHD/YefM family antitoxin component YafN of YafNO toxin-antitoxin module
MADEILELVIGIMGSLIILGFILSGVNIFLEKREAKRASLKRRSAEDDDTSDDEVDRTDTFEDDVWPVEHMEENAAAMVDYVYEHRNPVMITQDEEARAVLLDIETYQDIKTAFSLIKLVRLAEKDTGIGRRKKAEDTFPRVEGKLQEYA